MTPIIFIGLLSVQRKARQKAFEGLPEDAQMVKVIDAMIRTTHHSYDYRHLGELGQLLPSGAVHSMQTKASLDVHGGVVVARQAHERLRILRRFGSESVR